MAIDWDIFNNTAPVLIAGPTASGKSELALQIAERFGGDIVNADALQIYAGWNVLTACPSGAELARAPHHLYRYVPNSTPYSVGKWLGDVAGLLPALPARPIFVGGTGLFFRSLTEGLVDIPTIAPQFRVQSEQILATGGLAGLTADLPAPVQQAIDCNNPKRVQRAWEVWAQTGRHITDWHKDTPPGLIDLGHAVPIVLSPGKDWLNTRIATRFHQMITQGALDEALANMPEWDPQLTANQAIGAPELVAHLRGEMTLDTAIDLAITATHQYAKRQRTWFRKRMRDWQHIDPALGF